MAEYVQLTHTATEVDAAIEAIKTKAEQTALTAESAAREAADTALGKRIDAKAEQSALTAETAAREAAQAEAASRFNALPRVPYIDRLCWQIGGISGSNGAIVPSTKNRIAMTDIWTATENITFTIAEGFRIYCAYFDENGSYLSSSGWHQKTWTLRSNVMFRMQIARVQEQSGETADVALLKAQLQTDHDLEFVLRSEFESQLSTGIPSYYKAHLAEKIAEANAIAAETDLTGDSFVFITDLHWEQNAKNSPALVKQVLKETTIDKCFVGGDLLTKEPDRQSAVNVLRDCTSSFPRAFFINGNHDRNSINNGSDSSVFLTPSDVYSLTQKKNENVVSKAALSDFYYYIDNTAKKIRYIFLDTGTGLYLYERQLKWLCETLQSAEDGWTNVLLVHALYVYSPTSGTFEDLVSTRLLLTRIADAYRSRGTVDFSAICSNFTSVYDFAEAKGDLACIICGHAHRDADFTTAGGVPIILTACDKNQKDDWMDALRPAGTVEEQAFDLFFLNPAERTIQTVRIGHGANRSFTY